MFQTSLRGRLMASASRLAVMIGMLSVRFGEAA